MKKKKLFTGLVILFLCSASAITSAKSYSGYFCWYRAFPNNPFFCFTANADFECWIDQNVQCYGTDPLEPWYGLPLYYDIECTVPLTKFQ